MPEIFIVPPGRAWQVRSRARCGVCRVRASEGISPRACRWRSSHSSTGEIGIEVIANPSASEIAEAMTAVTGMHPASPAPLMPNGFSGDGVSRWSISMCGTSEA